MKRIHIVGCGPRSGTTLLAEMMIACFDIDLHTAHENSIYKIPPRDAAIFLTKRPFDVLVIEPVLRIVPDLHVVYMLRDPRDMIVSRHAKAVDRYWAGLSFWKTYAPVGRKLQSHPRFTTVRYEELVGDPDRIQNDLIRRMPFLVKRHEFRRYHMLAKPSKDSLDALGGVRPASKSSIGNWRRHLPRVAGQLRIHGSIADDLIEYGYEKDDSWLKELEGIEPDLSPSYWPEQFSEKRLRWIRRTRSAKALIVLFGHYRPTNWLMRLIASGYSKLRDI